MTNKEVLAELKKVSGFIYSNPGIFALLEEDANRALVRLESTFEHRVFMEDPDDLTAKEAYKAIMDAAEILSMAELRGIRRKDKDLAGVASGIRKVANLLKELSDD